MTGILILFGVIILILLFLMLLMHRRIQQLVVEIDGLKSKMNITTSELEALSRNVEEYKKLKM
jgi:cell division protein FtsL